MRERLIKLLKRWFNSKGDCAEIADYLLENGVIVPPCKVGDAMYCIHNGKVVKGITLALSASSYINSWIFVVKCRIFDGISMNKEFFYGKTVFLTREEAEKALEGGARDD